MWYCGVCASRSADLAWRKSSPDAGICAQVSVSSFRYSHADRGVHVIDSHGADGPEAHVSAAEVARHVAGTSTLAERARGGAHLAEWEGGTSDGGAAWRFQGRRSPGRRWLAAGTAAAALIAGVL